MRNLIRLNDIQSLLQIHTRAKRLVACAREHSTTQLGLCIVPLPQGAQLNCALYGKTIAEFGAVDCDLEDVLCGEGDERVDDVWVWCFYPVGHGVFCAWGCHL